MSVSGFSLTQSLRLCPWLTASAWSLMAAPHCSHAPFPAFLLLALGDSRPALSPFPVVPESPGGNPSRCLEEAMGVTQEPLASPSPRDWFGDLGLLRTEVALACRTHLLHLCEGRLPELISPPIYLSSAV